jgi:hypothetical protein
MRIDICNFLSKEFKLNNINFEPNIDFNWIDAFGSTTNRFGFDYKRIIVFRLFSFYIILVSFVCSIKQYIDKDCIQYWGLYLTHCTVCIAILYSSSGLYITYTLKNYPDNFKLHIIPRYVQFHWALQQTAFVISFLIPVAFWIICLTSDSPTDPCYVTIEPNTVLLHGVNSFLVISDIIITRQPFMVLHGIYPLVFGFLYLFLTYVHHKLEIGDCEHPNQDYPIYDELNWNNIHTVYKWYITLLCITTINYLMHYIHYRKYRLREYKSFNNHISFSL